MSILHLSFTFVLFQTLVSGLTSSTVLRDLRPDTEYSVTLVPVYADVEGKRASENGKTSKFPPAPRLGPSLRALILCSASAESLGGVKNLQVTEPTTSSLNVRWDPAEGGVRQYRIFYVPASGGAEDMVRHVVLCLLPAFC